MGLAVHVASEMCAGFWLDNLMEIDHTEELGVDESIFIGILKKRDYRVWTGIN
jgi:hypothetical protein